MNMKGGPLARTGVGVYGFSINLSLQDRLFVSISVGKWVFVKNPSHKVLHDKANLPVIDWKY